MMQYTYLPRWSAPFAGAGSADRAAGRALGRAAGRAAFARGVTFFVVGMSASPVGHRRFGLVGSTSVNVEPLPSSLLSEIRPPSMVASRRQIARPRPAPPYSRVG